MADDFDPNTPLNDIKIPGFWARLTGSAYRKLIK